MQKKTDIELEDAGWEITLPAYFFKSQTWILVVIAIFLAVLLFRKATDNTQTPVMNTQSVQQKK